MEKTTIITILFFSVFILTGVGLATENSLLIELPKKIYKSSAYVTSLQQKYELQIKQQDAQIKNIVYQLQNAKNQDQIYSLQQQYQAIRAESLASTADKLIKMESAFLSMDKNLEQLGKARNDSQKFGIGKNINRNDLITKQEVRNMIKGFKSIMHMAKNNNPEINLTNDYDTLQMMNASARTFYTNRRNDTLEDEKRFILGCLNLSISLQKHLKSEQDHLLSNMYYIDASQMRRKFGKLKIGILGSGNILQGLKQHHSMDEKILNYSKLPENIHQANYNTDFNETIVDW